MTTTASGIYRFGEFRLDPAARELWRGDEEIPLHRKAFDCIVFLIEHRNRAASRDELFAAVWGDIQLSDGVLGQSILEARRALDDTGEEQQVIKTVRAFGYRWVAPVEVVEPQETAGGNETIPSRRAVWLWVLLAFLAVGALVTIPGLLREETDSHAPQGPPVSPAEGEIALLLPVTVEAGAEHAWVRLGLMDLIANRLREAGQTMVPSDTVIALIRGLSPEPGPDELGHLATTTGARLVLAAHAKTAGTRWTISLRSLLGAEPPLTAVAEAYDVLQAAQVATDRMAVDLGLTPAAEPGAEPRLQMLLQQIEAAMLAQQMDVARVLIEEADPELRENPEVRWQRHIVDFHNRELAAARRGFESLLEEISADRDPVHRARTLNSLSVVHMSQRHQDEAERTLREAERLLEGQGAPSLLGGVRLNLAFVALERRDLEAAGKELAQARMLLQGIGDAQRLATLSTYAGALSSWQGRWNETLRAMHSAAERYAAVHDIGGELLARANMIEAYLMLLDPQAATSVETRLDELLAQTTNPELSAIGILSKSLLQHTLGQQRSAKASLDEVLTITEAQPGLRRYRMAALALIAERAVHDGDAALAAATAREVVAGLASEDSLALDETHARAWLSLVRASIAEGDPSGPSTAAAAMTDWATRSESVSAQIYASLARAEATASEDRAEAAEAAFEHAFELADATRVPFRLLQVARSYVPWLLDERRHGSSDSNRALLIADRLVGYADQQYEAALLQLRTYHAVGSASAWRIALARASSLAGERRIPPELLDAPGSVRPRSSPARN